MEANSGNNWFAGLESAVGSFAGMIKQSVQAYKDIIGEETPVQTAVVTPTQQSSQSWWSQVNWNLVAIGGGLLIAAYVISSFRKE